MSCPLILAEGGEVLWRGRKKITIEKTWMLQRIIGVDVFINSAVARFHRNWKLFRLRTEYLFPIKRRVRRRERIKERLYEIWEKRRPRRPISLYLLERVGRI